MANSCPKYIHYEDDASIVFTTYFLAHHQAQFTSLSLHTQSNFSPTSSHLVCLSNRYSRDSQHCTRAKTQESVPIQASSPRQVTRTNPVPNGHTVEKLPSCRLQYRSFVYYSSKHEFNAFHEIVMSISNRKPAIQLAVARRCWRMRAFAYFIPG